MAAHIRPSHAAGPATPAQCPQLTRITKTTTRALLAILFALGVMGGAWISTTLELEFLRPVFIGLTLIGAAFTFK